MEIPIKSRNSQRKAGDKWVAWIRVLRNQSLRHRRWLELEHGPWLL
jgi:hypothetical protein